MVLYPTQPFPSYSLDCNPNCHVHDVKELGYCFWYTSIQFRVAKFDPKVGRQKTTKIKSAVVLILILVILILFPQNMYVVLVLILLFLLVRER